MILACPVLRSSAGLAKMQVTGYGRGFRHLQPYMRRVPSVTAPLTIGMYSAKVGTREVLRGAKSRSSGEIPSPASNRRAASNSAEPVIRTHHQPVRRCDAAGR